MKNVISSGVIRCADTSSPMASKMEVAVMQLDGAISTSKAASTNSLTQEMTRRDGRTIRFGSWACDPLADPVESCRQMSLNDNVLHFDNSATPIFTTFAQVGVCFRLRSAPNAKIGCLSSQSSAGSVSISCRLVLRVPDDAGVPLNKSDNKIDSRYRTYRHTWPR